MCDEPTMKRELLLHLSLCMCTYMYVSAVHECTLSVLLPTGVAAGIDFLLDVGVPHGHGYCYDWVVVSLEKWVCNCIFL